LWGMFQTSMGDIAVEERDRVGAAFETKKAGRVAIA